MDSNWAEIYFAPLLTIAPATKYPRGFIKSYSHIVMISQCAFAGFLILQWFKKYLSGRRQSVSCNGTNSGICNISTGVPQSSTLGPFLFLIFINDLPQHIRIGSSNIFAGDSAIYTTGKSFMDTKRALQSSVYDAGRSRWIPRTKLLTRSFDVFLDLRPNKRLSKQL